MKNFVTALFLFAASAFILTSCDKDQRCVNWLDGSWNVTSMIVFDSAGNESSYIDTLAAQGLTFSGRMDFEKYSVKNDANGTGAFYIQVSGTVLGFPVDERDTTNYSYQILNDCETILLQEDGSSEADESTVAESGRSRMVIESYDADNNETTRITIEK